MSNNPQPNDQFRQILSGIEASPVSQNQVELSGIVMPAVIRGKRLLPRAILFGGIAGSLMGALVGEACCWLSGLDDRIADGTLMGAGVGAIVGAFIAIVERTIRGPLVKPDIATAVGILFGISPALVSAIFASNALIFQPGGAFIESLIGGPIVGFLIGALMDRAFEAICQKNWGKGLVIATVGLSVCAGLGWVMIWNPLGPDPAGLAKKAEKLILRKWHEGGGVQQATIDKVTLVRKTGRHYTGIVDATIDGRPERFRLSVVVVGQTIGVTWEPID